MISYITSRNKKFGSYILYNENKSINPYWISILVTGKITLSTMLSLIILWILDIFTPMTQFYGAHYRICDTLKMVFVQHHDTLAFDSAVGLKHFKWLDPQFLPFFVNIRLSLWYEEI